MIINGVAAIKCGYGFVGIEREKEYCEIAEKRIGYYPVPIVYGALE